MRAAAALAFMFILAGATAASADHTDPASPLAPTTAPVEPGVARGLGTWQVIARFPANPGTDLDIFRAGRAQYAATGTLGGGSRDHVGQRILRLTTDDGAVAPAWVADHGSAACAAPDAVGNIRLQHDVAVTPDPDPVLLLDTTDGPGRCHDPAGGGLELVDISDLASPRELHLTRHDGTTHTVTVDEDRPWIVYASNGEYNAQAWIDVLDVRSCMRASGTLAERRAACRPVVHRIPLQPEWTSQRLADSSLARPRSCHDITVRGPLLYCAAIHATVILDVSGLTDPSGAVRGTPLPCRLAEGTSTGAAVTDCSLSEGGTAETIAAYDALGRPAAEGWRFVGTINHAGVDDGEGLTNRRVPSAEGIAISHQAEPVPAAVGDYLIVSDERGGGVSAPGASCAPGLDNPVGNGGLHVFDVSDPTQPVPAPGSAGGGNAVFITDAVVPAEEFCTVHVFHHLPDERRIVAAWYTQGIVVVDYAIDEAGRWTFTEMAGLVLPGAQTWAVDLVSRADHGDGTATYTFLANDMVRGADVLAWTGPANPIAPPVPETAPALTPAPPAQTTASPPAALPSTSAATSAAVAAPVMPAPPSEGAADGSRAAPQRTGAVLLVVTAIALPAAVLLGKLARGRQSERRATTNGEETIE